MGLLNVDLSHIDRLATSIAEEDNNKIVQGEIITMHYLDSICQEINDGLQETGSITLGEMVQRLSLPYEFVSNARNNFEKEILPFA